MTRVLNLWFLLLIAIAPVSVAEELAWPLEGKSTASGKFQQTVTGVNGDLALYSSGQFVAMKPDHFRWNIESPDRQLLIATPKAFWQWDKDLDVVILRDAPELTHLPISAIWDGALSESPSGGGVTHQFGGGVKNLSVSSPDKNTIIVIFKDPLGQETRFEFTLDTQAAISLSSFEMTVPENADFYDESSSSARHSEAVE